MKMDDPLDRLLEEWQARGPSAGMDARMLAAYRQAARPSPWRRMRGALARVPAFAVVIAAAVAIGFRAGEPRRPPIEGYVTRIEASGFQPLPNGAVRVVSREALKHEEVQ